MLQARERKVQHPKNKSNSVYLFTAQTVSADRSFLLGMQLLLGLILIAALPTATSISTRLRSGIRVRMRSQ